MSSLARQIEKYLKKMINRNEGPLRLKRKELADQFNCVPSQINYVLKTRFTLERGYVVESQRGGGGFIQIREVVFDHPEEDYVKKVIKMIEDNISQQQALNIIENLTEKEILTQRERDMLRAMLHRRNLNIKLPYRDYIRARLLKVALGAIMKD